MHFFNSKALACEIKSESLSQKELFHYFLGGAILHAIQIQWLALRGKTEFNYLGIIYAVTYLVIVISGSLFLFKTNSKGDGRSFIERYICVSFPVSLKIVCMQIAFYAVYILILILANPFPVINSYTVQISYIYSIIGFVFIILFYYFMYSHLAFIAGVKKKI